MAMGFQTVERFAFDRVFTSAPPRTDRSPAELMLEIATLQAEVAALRDGQEGALALARAEGFEAGMEQARAERETALLSAVDALHAGVETLDQRFGDVAGRMTSEAAEMAVAAAELLAARTLDLAPADAIDAAIGRAIGQVTRGTELVVRVHPDWVEMITACVARRQAADRRNLNLSVSGDATLAPGDAVIDWERGGLHLDASARRAEIAAELETILPKAAARDAAPAFAETPDATDATDEDAA